MLNDSIYMFLKSQICRYEGQIVVVRAQEAGRSEGGGCGHNRVALGALVIELSCVSAVVVPTQIIHVMKFRRTKYAQAYTYECM